MNPSPFQPGPEDADIPEQLSRNLAAAFAPCVPAAQPLREERLFEAARRAARQSRTRRRHVDWPLGLAAAACLLLAGALSLPWWMGEPRSGPRSALRPGDINADQRIDILDALALALAVKAGNSSVSSDINGDGTVDRADADALARRVVLLHGGSS